MLAQGIDIRVVQQILGHSQLSQTQRYTHVTSELVRHAADRMGEALYGCPRQNDPGQSNCNNNSNQETREDDHQIANDQLSTGEVFTFGSDLGERGRGGGLPTG
jgi:integrase-like protein